MVGSAVVGGRIPGFAHFVQTQGWAMALLIPQAVIIPGIAIAAVLSEVSRRRFVARLIEARGQLCLNCEYPLGDSLGFCPECGSEYDLISLRRGWCSTYPDLATEVDWPTPTEPAAARGSSSDATKVHAPETSVAARAATFR